MAFVKSLFDFKDRTPGEIARDRVTFVSLGLATIGMTIALYSLLVLK